MGSPVERSANPMKQTTTRCAAIFGVYLLGALLLTHQAWWSSTLIGGSDTPDRAGSIWTSWWMGTALLSAQNPFMATDNFVPIGQTALSQYNLLDAFLAAPGLYLFGPRVGFNLACVFTIASTAAAGHLLARVAGSGRAGAWMVGIGLGTWRGIRNIPCP